MAVTGEITGTARRLGSGGPEPLAGLGLELARADGTAGASSVTGYDGFFAFADLLPGSYTLRVAAGEAGRLAVSPPPPRSFEITPSGNCFDGISMLLAPAAPFPEDPDVAG
jgi:hypothetical protein